ncbi:porin [Pandoraea soli]
MKKNLIGLSLLTAIPLAHAQSSVTLYGIADAGLVFNSNAGGKQQYAMASGGMGADRWGLKGTEDLGGGLKALFTIEGGFGINNGTMSQGGTFAGRQAFVGLSSNYGTVTLGRQYSSGYWYVGPMSAGGSWALAGTGYGAHPGDVDNLDSFNRVNNAVIYTTPTIKGLTASAMYGFGNVAGSTATNRIVAIGAGYVNGPVTLGVGYEVANQPNFSAFGNNASSSTTGNNISSPVDTGYASAKSQKILSLGAAYTIGNATVTAIYSNTRFDDLGSTAVAGLTTIEAAYRGSETFNIGELGAKYMLTPALSLGVSYAYTKASGVNDTRYQQVDAGVDYSLSKQTDLYAVAVYQRASGTDSRGRPAVAAVAGATASGDDNQTVAMIGIRHRF